MLVSPHEGSDLMARYLGAMGAEERRAAEFRPRQKTGGKPRPCGRRLTS